MNTIVIHPVPAQRIEREIISRVAVRKTLIGERIDGHVVVTKYLFTVAKQRIVQL